MFLFGGGTKSKKDDSKKKEKQEIKDLKKRAKEAKKKRESVSNEIIKSTTEQPTSIPISSPNISLEESKIYQVYDVYKVQLNSKIQHLIEGEIMIERSAKPQWGIDPMLIDEELLYLNDQEADRVYQELKIKSERRREMELRQNRLSSQMSLDEDSIKKLGVLSSQGSNIIIEQTVSLDLASSRSNKSSMIDNDIQQKIKDQQKEKSQSYEKIQGFIKKSNTQEKLEFTQGIINFAHKIDKRFLIEGLLPNLELLTREKSEDIKIALIDQFIPIINYLSEVRGVKGYEESCKTVFQLLDKLLYDQVEQIRNKAIQILTELRHVVQQKENDLIMQLTLKLAHDENEMNRISSLKIMNELAPHMGELLCESFICPEIRSLSIDELATVRLAVIKNFMNATKQVSQKYFNQHIFPMYDRLTKDSDEKTRKACAESIAEISQLCNINEKGEILQEMFFKFLKDATSKVVRGTAYQNIGAFIANFKDKIPIDSRIIDFYISTTDASSNRDVCYYSSYNFPAFIYVLGSNAWPKLKPIYIKCQKFNDPKIQKTLAHSIHELAKILGPEITQQDLVPIIEKFMTDQPQFKDAKQGALKNLHIFLEQIQPKERLNYLDFILPPKENKELDWRVKYILAKNLGDYCLLFDEETVFQTFLPIFFRFSFDPVAKVAETASLNFSNVLKVLSPNQGRVEQIIKIVKKYFLLSKTYKRRQLFVMMCSSIIKSDLAFFNTYFKRDLLTLVDDKVITVRMTLARILTQTIIDKDIDQALNRLVKDHCGDIRELVLSFQMFKKQQHITSESVISSSMLDTREESMISSQVEEDMVVENRLETIDIDMHMEIMVEDEMQAAMQQFIDTQSKLRSSIYGEELYK